jgi:hypothetical protein
MRATFSAADWRRLSREIADALADLTLTGKGPMTSAEADLILDRAAQRLCRIMLSKGVPPATIQFVLNGMPEAFDAGLRRLDAAPVQKADRVASNYLQAKLGR